MKVTKKNLLINFYLFIYWVVRFARKLKIELVAPLSRMAKMSDRSVYDAVYIINVLLILQKHQSLNPVKSQAFES